MNNKFFADKNDFFKYDLLLELIENSPFLKQLTLIPMLTRADGRRGGDLTDYERGNRRGDLYEFLKECLETGRRDISHLREYFAKKSFSYTPFRDSAFFTNRGRDEYFHAIPDAALDHALIFIDPDNGLIDSGKQTDDKHLTYDELARLNCQVKDPSMVVVYHHLARVQRDRLFRTINIHLQQLRPKLNTAFVSDNRIAFLVLARESDRTVHVESVLRNYSSVHGLRPGLWLPRDSKVLTL